MKLPTANAEWGTHYAYVKETVDKAMKDMMQALTNCPWDTDQPNDVMMYRINGKPRIGLTLTYAGKPVAAFWSSFSTFLDETENLYLCFEKEKQLLDDLEAFRNAIQARIDALKEGRE
jgi:hypothetical protein